MNAHEELIASVQAEVQRYEHEAAQAKLFARAADLLVLLLQDLRERGGDFRLPNRWHHDLPTEVLWRVGRTVLTVTVDPDNRPSPAFVGELRVDGSDVARFETSCAAVLADWILARLREAEKRRSP